MRIPTFFNLRWRFMLAPLIGVLLAIILLVATEAIHEPHEQNLEKLNQTDLPKVGEFSKVSILLVQNHSKLVQVLVSAIGHRDEEHVYMDGRLILDSLHQIENQFLRNLTDSQFNIEADVASMFSGYRESTISAIELSTVNPERARVELLTAQQALDRLLQTLLLLTDQHLLELKTGSEMVEQYLAAEDSIIWLAVAIILVMVFTAVYLPNRLAKDMDHVNESLLALSRRETEIKIPRRADPYMSDLLNAVKTFRHTLLENEQQQRVMTRAVSELKASQQRLSQAQKIAHMGSWELNLIDNQLNWSDEVYRIFEINPDQFEASLEGFLHAIHPDDRDFVARAYQDSITNQSLYDIEHRLLMQDGRVKYVHERCETSYDAEGNPLRSLGTVQDITLRKSAEAALQASEEWFKAITQQANEGITVADPEGNYTFVNAAFIDMMGYSEQELLAMTVFDVKAPEQDTGSFERSKTSKEGLPIEVILERKDGSTFIAEVVGKMIEINGESHVLGTIRDITAQVEAEEQIRTLSEAIEQSPVSVMITNTRAELEYVNSAFEKVTGYTFAEVRGKNPSIIQSKKTPPDVYYGIWQALNSGETWEGELLNKKKDGSFFWEYCHFAPVIDENGNTRHFLAVKEDITKRKQQEELILQQAHFDNLTELPNRFLSLDRLSQLISEAQRNDEKVAVLFLDLDDFKKINDSLGHDTGDKLLIEASSRLAGVLRKGDTVGRLGGDEFIILLGGLEHASDAQPIAENLLQCFRQAFPIDGRELMLTASIGIAVYPEDSDSVSELLRKSDSAMYHSKESGRNTYSYFTEQMNREVSRRLELEEQIHGALGRNEFSLVFQPQIVLHSGQIMGAEALLRWNNPALGEVSPTEFIPIAEQTGLILPIGQFVLEQALSVTAQLQQKYDPDFRIAVNLSPRQFRDPGLVEHIEQTITKAGINSEQLELEITEGVLMSGHSYITESIEALNSLGVSIAMDDFGTGYSSLSYLRNFPFNVLKIDRSFVNDITEDPADRELITAIVAMSQSLKLKVVAEGVETEEQYSELKAIGCDFAQGYLFSKPVTLQDLEQMLERGQKFLIKPQRKAVGR